MKKYFFITIIVFLFSTLKSYSEIIKEIQITGNKRISKETILVLGEISKDVNFDANGLNQSIKNLYQSNFFQDVNLTFNNGILVIKVVENPIIEDIEIKGVKSSAFLEKLGEVMILKDRMSFSDSLLNNDLNTINNVLKANGFYFANVETSMIKNDDLNSVRLIIDIDEGKKARIKKILFVGDKNIKDKKLLEVIGSEEHKFWKFVSNKVYLNAQLIDLDKRLLENYYKNQGFYNVKILDSYAELDTEGFLS